MAKHQQPQELIGNRPYFREWRKAAGLSQEQLAERMGTTGATISKREARHRKGVSLDYLEKFAEAVGCNPWDPIAWPPGTLAQINSLLFELQPDDLELILRIVRQFAELRAG